MQSGFDVKPPAEPIRKGLEVEREYTDTKGKPIGKVKLGSEIEVHLKLRATERGHLGNVALVDLLPGGFEVVLSPPHSAQSESSGESEEESKEQSPKWSAPFGTEKSTWRPDYADAREDRVVLYGEAGSSAREFVYRIRAVNAGTYSVAPAYGESMYDRSVQASSMGGKIEVEQ
ncbi:MAG: hypothetical protein P4L55_04605 [Syntrophobacteraceae bacterium]|nr:hypothetical protein [Syntrophobacteraceae bacterium]